MIRVAIADDSPFTCNLLASYIESGGDCTVVGMAHDAASTLELVRSTTPDVLTLDLQMPDGDGLDLLQRLSAEPPVSVVVISGVTRLAAATTLRALELGAIDFVLKYTPGAPVSRASLRREIVAKVKIAAGAQPAPRTAPAVPTVLSPAPPRGARRPAVRAAETPDSSGVVVLGASTGGPRALSDVLSQLGADFGVPCVVVQHLPAAFTAPFAAQLERNTRLRVQVAQTGDRVEKGTVFVTPGSVHLVFRPDGRIHLQAPGERDVYRPSIDIAMISAADAYGASTVGVLMTGFGEDGVEGLKRIRAAGGLAIIQDPASCVVANMAERALERVGGDYVAAPERIGQVLLTLRRKA